ncbi:MULTISPECIES: ABC transporter substrate-binding protein [Aminobacter]|uniref:Amino acid ABC transporter n=1 Tax=Aminobacter aminovorans TaxID=83263 RepID=A0AAC8YWJ4_AMIAI|nr:MULTISPECIES: ABC transporter substrate-binding protein [Aminobacter]AMS45186.1 Amino acid ABC transporter [Aminobacter aminovorans]MBB3705055.1 polar amino acid transport system substrate-binding protein [Aminobacter aminovorans]PWK58057.1 amino acid ABC transporter substrate-binding protein (PAAT family) [Aminobacter sp. AP02]
MKKSLCIVTAVAALLAANTASSQDIQKQAQNDDLRARLPQEIRDAGKMIAVNNGSFPPYEIVTGTELTGATKDISTAIGELLGITIDHASVAGLPALLSGVNSGRYQFAMGPVGDYPDRQKANDFVDWAREYVVFAVEKGNPSGITSLDATCGKRIAVMAGGSAEKVIKEQSEKCVGASKPAVEVQSFTDQPSSILAVRSKRSDAFFSSQAPLTYFVQQANGQLELAAVGQANGFKDIYQGAVVKKDSPLGGVLLDSFKILKENGTYAQIMKKWGLENNIIDTPGINQGQ